MLSFAYDGSINGDWVSHYAARLAASLSDKTLHLVHVRDGRMGERELEQKLNRLQAECERQGVTLQSHIELLARSVLYSIRSTVDPGPGNYLICGTRVRERKRGLLSGTVSEKLLRLGHCNVLALRVVQPGLLGCPRRLLLPVSGHPRGFCSGLPFLKLFGSDIQQMRILFVRGVARWRFRMLSSNAVDQLRQPGQAYCERVEREICEQLGLGPTVVDTNTVVSDDVPKEIVIAANKARSQLIYMGASEKNLTERFLYGNPIEQVLRAATCDVAIYRGVQ